MHSAERDAWYGLRREYRRNIGGVVRLVGIDMVLRLNCKHYGQDAFAAPSYGGGLRGRMSRSNFGRAKLSESRQHRRACKRQQKKQR